LTVGADVFGVGRENKRRHGAALVVWAQLDHVLPYKQGGRTSLDNIVTSCWACNYGKDRFSTSQLGLEDPRDYAPMNTKWDGLVSLLPSLRNVASDRGFRV
jgi:hypothetical protein